MRINLPLILVALSLSGIMSQAQATYIERTITMDGDMSDWYDTDANTYDPAGDITNNAGQFSTDLEDGTGDLDSPLTSTGRDLRKFSFTWDDTYLYFYVERWASSTNITDWWFYIDSSTGGVAGTDPDGLMQSGEKLLRVSWQGNNRSTVATLYDYVESATGGDPLTNAGVGDGYIMPGGKTNAVSLYNTSYGATSGTEMETILAWTSIPGLTGPANIAFHISSSNGQNVPSNIIDNMDGPAGGQLFPRDLQISKVASVSSIRGLQSFTYTISVFNASIDAFNSVEITDNLPSEVTYSDPNYVASTGTYSAGVWSIPTIASNATETLTITVTANSVATSTDVDNTATLTGNATVLSEDDDSTNNSATATVTILPIPNLTIVKATVGGVSTASPGDLLTYIITVTNSGGEDGEMIELTDRISPYEQLKVDYGGATPFVFNPNTSGLTINTLSYSSVAFPAWTHTLATNPPDEFDSDVTEFRIQFNGSMTNSGGSFTIMYQTQVR